MHIRASRPFRLLAVLLSLAGLPAAAPAQAPDAELLRISNYLNGVETMTGDFVQVGPDGKLSRGTFAMRRPGRLRFAFDPPNRALIVADGTWVGVCDVQIGVFDRFPLSETPLDLLLRERLDLREEDAVERIERAAGQLRVRAIDPEAPEEGSITLIFSDVPLALRQWVIVDAQGLTTTVALQETQTNISLDPRLFVLDEEACAERAGRG